jgi:AcrR family transcriptional regulator
MERVFLSHSASVSTGERKPREWASTPARRRQILDAALRCFDENGVPATTVEDICVAADLSVGSIYHHFAGKEDIREHLVREAMTEYRAGFVGALERGGDLASSLRHLVRFHVEWVENRPALTKLMLSAEESERSTPSGHEHYREYSDAIGTWLRRQARARKIRRMEPDLYSALLMGPLMEHARERTAGLTTATPAALERGLADGLLRVLVP